MTETELLLLQLEQAFDHRSWHGTNLLGSIRGIKPDQAAWRVAKNRHNIWEIIVHAAYWKYSVYRRIEGEGRGSFQLRGANWFKRPVENTMEELKADTGLLKGYHQKLLNAIKGLDEERLDEIPQGSRTTYRELIIGITAHDLYHAGQIQLLKRLQKKG